MLKPLQVSIDDYITRSYVANYNYQKMGWEILGANFSLYRNNVEMWIIDSQKLKNYIAECPYDFEYIQGYYEFDEVTRTPKNDVLSCLFLCKELKMLLSINKGNVSPQKNDIAILFDNSYSFNISYTELVNSFLAEISQFAEKEEDTPKLNIVTQTTDGFKLHEKSILDVGISIKDNYNEDFEPIYDKILSRLNTNKDKGLVLLHGNPGTGKTTFIRHICSKIKGKEIIYIPSEMAKVMADPAFLTFLIQHTNSILVVEDAEELLQSRDFSKRTSAISNILNMSDGLLSDVLNIQIICTFNCPLSNIDEALLRKGRIIAKYEFRELSLEKTKALLPAATSPMTLADIYNSEDQNFQVAKRNTIGFGLKAVV